MKAKFHISVYQSKQIGMEKEAAKGKVEPKGKRQMEVVWLEEKGAYQRGKGPQLYFCFAQDLQKLVTGNLEQIMSYMNTSNYRGEIHIPLPESLVQSHNKKQL